MMQGYMQTFYCTTQFSFQNENYLTKPSFISVNEYMLRFRNRFLANMNIMEHNIKWLQLWRVSETEFQLRSIQRKFWTCEGQGNSVFATKESLAGTKETFYIEKQVNSSRVHIKLQNGAYLQVHSRNSSL